ncbi:MAG: FHA domain-containing protein, partial [Oscillospiraceae bacterium]
VCYYAEDNSITAYACGISGENVTARIAGVPCQAVSEGDIYSSAERYNTLFLIDSSKSMQSFSDEISDFLLECIDKKRDNEYYSIGVFSSGNAPTYLCGFDNNQYNLEKSVSGLSYDFNSTYIYDNLNNALDTLRSESEGNFRRVVLFTDGNENSAHGITIDDCISKLNSEPVQVYTVTLLNSTKSNLEPLKNIARLARSTNAADIRITDGDKASESVSVLFEDPKDIYTIKVTADNSLCDGSLKALELSDGTNTAMIDIRMPMAEAAAEVSETEAVTEAEFETTAAEAVTTSAAEEEETSEKTIGKNQIIAIIAIAVAAAAVIVCIIMAVTSKKKKKAADEEPASLADNSDTMILSSRSGNTEILIGDNTSAARSVILRDVADSMKTFEVTLSESGAVIGRSSDSSSVVIDYDKSISRKHCKIFLRDNEVYVQDLGSGNKTYVNDVPISSAHILHNTDEIKIGRTKLRVTIK